MTQKEALKNILRSIDNPTLRRLFIANWLEDINWHYESQKITDGFTPNELTRLATMHDEHKRTDQRNLSLPFGVDGYELANTRLLPGFVHAFGRGIISRDWKGGVGDSLIQQLEEVINHPEL